MHKLAWVERHEGNNERALELFEQSAQLFEQVSDLRAWIALLERECERVLSAGATFAASRAQL